jgi:hypothetical protein
VVPGQWQASHWGSYPARTSPIFPDTDAYGGKYACRIEGLGAGAVAYFSHAVQEDANLYLRFEVTGVGKIWLDEFWLGASHQSPALQATLEKPWGDPLRWWAANQSRSLPHTDVPWSPKVDGELNFFANDLLDKYHNDLDDIEIVVERIA